MTDEPKKPKLSVVAQNSPRQIEANEAQERVDWALRQLAANLIRVVRGAGKPEDLIKQCADVVNAAVDHRDAAGMLPSSFAVASAIQLKHDELQYENDFWFERQLAYRSIVNGALQFTASKLLEQPLHVQRGQDEMDKGIRGLESAREELRKKRAAEERAARAKTSPLKKSMKRKTKKATTR